MTGEAAADFDVVVLGAGLAGGLPAAAYLQRAGGRVCLVEGGPECGPFYRSYDVAGIRFDHSPVNFSVMSPALEELELERYGYRVRRPEILYGTLDGRGRTTVFQSDPSRTAAELARWSERDAAIYRRIVSALPKELAEEVFFRPEPDLERARMLTAEALQLELDGVTAPELVETLFESDAVRIAVMAVPALNLFGDLLEPGQGALSWAWMLLLRSCVAPEGNGSLVTALERCFVGSGGVLLKNEPVRSIGGGGVVTTARELRAPAVVSNLGVRLTSDLLGRELRPGWSSARRTIATADVVLARPLRFPLEVPRLYLLWPTWEDCLDWLRREREEAFFGHLELTRFGERGLRVRFGTGPWLDERWDERRPRFRAALEDVLRRVDPQAEAETVVLKTPLDHWRDNPAATHGNPVGGDFVAGQWLGERLSYRTEVHGLYVSNGVWPPALSYLAPGRNAAQVVAADLGLTLPRTAVLAR